MNRFTSPLLVKALPYGCLFLSGAASLIYELVWIRQLSLVFGATLYAISAVLCAFMAGLALGAAGSARYLKWAAQSGKPLNLLFLYGAIEAGIGLYGLAFPWGLKLLESVYPALMGHSLGSGLSLHIVEFVLAALLMLPPTLLMGATLPVFASWAIAGRVGRIFSSMSVLYSVNTFGGVFGCLFTQWFAIEALGIQATLWTAVALNFAIFLVCLPYRKQSAPAPQAALEDEETPREPADETVLSRGWSLLLLLLFVFSGLAALANEILWTRILVFPLGMTLYSFALILATFLFCIALGSLISEKLLGSAHRVRTFLLLEFAIGAACLAILPLFAYLPEWTAQADRLFYDLENTPGRTLAVRSLFAFGLMFFPSLGFGLLFPLANRIHLGLFGSISDTLGKTYAFNTLGAVAGTALAPFVLIPMLGIRTSLVVLALGLLVPAGIGLLWFLDSKKSKLAVVCAGLALLVLGTTQISGSGGEGGPLLSRMEINVDKDRTDTLAYKEGSFATLAVVEDQETRARTLYVNGFSTATVSRSLGGSAYMQAMGFVPMMLHPKPERALVIGFGTGNTLGSVARFPGVEVDGVEIDPNVLTLAPWFSRWNHDVLNRPNVRMTIQDGRAYTRWTQNSYDVITLEPMSPVQAGVVHLYSRDFYEQALQRLNPGGLLMQWLPLHLVSEEDARAIVQTFRSVFPEVTVWNSFLTRIVLLVGSKEPVPLDKQRFERLMRNPDIRQQAEEMGVRSFLDFLDFYLTDGGRLDGYLTDAPVITDNRPILEFSPVNLLPPLKWQTDQSFVNLLRYRLNHFPEVRGVSPQEATSLKRNFTTRTAQRFSVFSRRYQGPGHRAFAAGQQRAGLESLDIYFQKIADRPVRLDGARWQEQ